MPKKKKEPEGVEAIDAKRDKLEGSLTFSPEDIAYVNEGKKLCELLGELADIRLKQESLYSAVSNENHRGLFSRDTNLLLSDQDKKLIIQGQIDELSSRRSFVMRAIAALRNKEDVFCQADED